MRRLTIVFVSLLVVAACKKPKHSADYADAKAAYDSVVSRMSDEAYADPEMNRVIDLLGRVPADSLDAAPAADLKATIGKERERVAEEAKVHAADLAVLHQKSPDLGPMAKMPDPTGKPATPAPLPDPAGAEITQPQAGLSEADFLKKFSGCFVEGEAINVTNLNVAARAFTLGNAEGCAAKHAAFANRVVLVANGKVMGTVTKDTVKLALDPSAADAGSAPAANPGK